MGPRGSSSEGGSGRASASSSSISSSFSWEAGSGLCTLTGVRENLGPADQRFGLAACISLFCFPLQAGSFLTGEVAEFGVWALVLLIGFVGLVDVVLLPWLVVAC